MHCNETNLTRASSDMHTDTYIEIPLNIVHEDKRVKVTKRNYAIHIILQ